MRNIYISLLLIILFISSCKAQNAPLYRIDRDNPEGTHFKDLDNDLSDFVGTWKWQSNDSIVTIEFQKW
jgi:PBP1b-binding outer membrane lipoprotein LpoB